MRNQGWLLALFGLLLPLAGCAAQPALTPPVLYPARAPATALERAEEQLGRAHYDEAERLLDAAQRTAPTPGVQLALGRLYLETGRYQRVIDLALRTKADGSEVLLHARALDALGRPDEALALVPMGETQGSLRLRFESALLRGLLLLELGRRSEAEAPLLLLVERANAGDIDALPATERGEAWALVGRAAHALRAPEDANDAYNRAEQLGSLSVRALLWRAELFLEKYDVGHAEEVLLEALAIAPLRSEALVLLARMRLEQALDFDEAERLVRLALTRNPQSTSARAVLAGNALHDLDLRTTEAELAQGLAVNPRDLELLSLKAAALFLAEDRAAFDTLVERVLALSPGYARLFEVVSEYAQWEHRYEDIERLLRRATHLDREDGRVRGELGLVLVRSGSDDAGVVELREAFRLDPYNVRVLNTLDLYEKLIPAGYQEQRHGPFQIRYPKAERALLERYVPELLDQAHQQMVERYGFTPRAPLSIEIYAHPSEFAVRTTGLPHAGLAGVCFGRKLATVSPSGQTANLGMTLWHELSHVFHIGLSESRVPRWLTEGFAEWETAHLGRGWGREMDEDLYRALREQRLPRLGTMSRAFTHADSMQDVGMAYHASKRLADWITATRGPTAAQRLLEEFGKKRLPDAVVPEVLGARFNELDREFDAWLVQELGRYQSQFVSRHVRGSLEDLHKAAVAKDATRESRIDLALALLQAGKLEAAEPALRTLLIEKTEAEVEFALARVLLGRGDKPGASALLQKLTASNHDGYEVRMVLGRVAASDQDWKTTLSESQLAASFDPSQQDAWTLAATAAHQLADAAAELDAVAHWAELSEHDGAVHRRYVTLLLAAERYADAARAAERAIWAGLGVFETHRLAAEAFSRSGQKKRAAYELDTAVLLAQSDADKASIERARRALR